MAYDAAREDGEEVGEVGVEARPEEEGEEEGRRCVEELTRGMGRGEAARGVKGGKEGRAGCRCEDAFVTMAGKRGVKAGEDGRRRAKAGDDG